MVAGIVTEVAVLVVAVALLVSVVMLFARRQFKELEVTVGSAKATLTGIEGKVDEINHAVNNVPKGAPTLVQRVDRLEDGHERFESHHQWECNALQLIADNIGVNLPKKEAQ